MVNSINSVSTYEKTNFEYEKKTHEKSKTDSQKNDTGVIADIGNSPEKSATYRKPVRKMDSKEIDRIWKEAQRASESLRSLVEKLIRKQTEESDVFNVKVTVIVEGENITEAGNTFFDDEEWGVAAVSSRIVDFAKSLAGGDKSKISVLRDAIEQGFKAAEEAFGGELPEISKKTYDEVMKQLDNWEQEE